MKTKRQQIKFTCVAIALTALAAQAQAQSFTEVVQNALTIYPSMLSAKAKTEAQRSDIDRARAAHMPQISYGLTRSQYASGQLPSTVQANTRSPSVRLNLWSGGRIEADARRSEALTLGSEFTEAQTRDDVALLAAEAYINWARAIDMHALAIKNHAIVSVDMDDCEAVIDILGPCAAINIIGQVDSAVFATEM
jgi:outer membrane protein TolC